jgi:chaperonin GroEL
MRYYMSAKEVHYDHGMMEKMLSGMNLFSKTVGITLGPKGRNVIYDKSEAAPTITKDGVTVAKEIDFENGLENLGCNLLKVSAAKSSDSCGDGTTTTTILTNYMIRQGWKLVAAGHNPYEIKKGFEIGLKQVKEFLNNNKKIVKKPFEIEQIATISANGDAQIGKMIADAMDMIGLDGVISVEDSPSVETTLKIVEGMKIDAGYMSSDFLPADAVKLEFENPLLFITSKRINSLHDISGVLQQAVDAKAPLVVICDNMTNEALTTFLVNTKKGVVKGCVIRAPGIGNKKIEALRDVAIATGAFFVCDESGKVLNTVTLEDMGVADKVVITAKDTLILGGKGEVKDIQARIEQIRHESQQAWSVYDIERYQDRLSRLVGGIAVIYVGATTETELKERKARVEDALNATQSAVSSGVLPGGGIAMLRAKTALDYTEATEQQMYGLDILSRTLEVQVRHIVGADMEGSVVVDTLEKSDVFSYGYNARTNRYEDLYVSGVLDPVHVITTALETAVSLAGVMITTGAAVIQKSND